MGGGLAWLYDENPLTGNSDLTQYEQDFIADAYNDSVLGQTQCNPTAHTLVEASLGVSVAATTVASAAIMAGADPWLGTAGIHGAEHGLGEHFELIIRGWDGNNFKLIFPGKTGWPWVGFN